MPPKPRSGLLVRTIAGEVVILDRAAGHVHRLNATASCIWNHCDGVRSPAEIAEAVSGAFEASRDDALRDVVRTLADLERLGLLVEEGKS